MKKGGIYNGFIVAGISIVIITVLACFAAQLWSHLRYESPDYYIGRIFSAMPEITDGIPEKGSYHEMARFEIDGLDFVGVLEMPDYALSLPVYASWEPDKLTVFPCLFTGTASNSNLIIGSAANKGQFSFVKQLSVEDKVTFTDMTGVRFEYSISDIKHSKNADRDSLIDETVDLVIFIKDSFALDYVIIDAKNNGG